MGAGQDGDRYVTGGVNWDSYSLEALVAMVAENASAPQLERLADDWRAAGAEVIDAASVLDTSLTDLMEYWSGTAAEQARKDVALNAQWVADLGDTARNIGDPVQEAAGALKAAQDAMPQVPGKPLVPPAQAADSADLGFTTGGLLVSAINGTAAGTESAFTAQQEEAKLKTVAVEAMKRFEGAAITIDQTTPKFEERSDELREPIDRTPVPPPTDTVETTVSYTTDMELRWSSLTGGDPGTSAQSYDDGAYRSGASSGGGGFSSGGYTGGGGGGIGGGAIDGGGGARPIGRGMATGLTEAAPGVGRPGGMSGGPLAASSGGGHGMGMGGMPMGGGMGAGAQGGTDEHRRRYPFDAEDPFALDQKASPPVIGL